MTNEEARSILIQDMESLKANPLVTVDECLYQALDTAIKALESQRNLTNEELYQSFIKLEAENERLHDALESQRWIPVSERLPEPNVAVLTYINTGATETYCLAYWNNMCETWEEWIGIDLIEKDKGYKVIAWRELPEPY